MADKIQNAYETSKNIYDDVLTQRNIFSKLYIKLFWSGTDDNDIARKVLSYVPNDFSGKLLDVPVGTAVFTENRLYEAEREKRESAYDAERRSQVGSGDRSQRIRTYNFPQGRVTDHRIGLTLYKIDAIMDGALDELIDALVTADQAEKLKQGQEAE